VLSEKKKRKQRFFFMLAREDFLNFKLLSSCYSYKDGAALCVCV